MPRQKLSLTRPMGQRIFILFYFFFIQQTDHHTYIHSLTAKHKDNTGRLQSILPSMSAATGAAGAPTPGASSSFNWLTQLRQHYLAGKHCDVSIKISLPAQPPPAKRARARSGRRKKKNDGEESNQEKNEGEIITIPVLPFPLL